MNETLQAIALAIFNFILDTDFLISAYEIGICLMLMKKRSYFWLRLLVFIPFIILTNNVVGLVDYPNSVLVFEYVHLGYLLYFLISTLLCWFCFDSDYLQILYFCTAAYIVENLSSQIMGGLNIAFFGGTPEVVDYYDAKPFLCTAIMLLIEFVLYYVIIFVLVNHFRKNYDFHIKWMHITVIEVLTLFVIVFINYIATMKGYMNLFTRMYAGIVDITLLLFQFVFFRETQLIHENDVTKNIIDIQARQYQMSKENVDLINRKVHDFKHQLAAMKFDDDEEIRRAVVDEAAKAISNYQSFAKTGNPVIDTILTQKLLYCDSKHITMTYMLDATRLGFIDKMDLASLFGNAIDNAIEAVEKEDEANRIIDITMQETDNMLCLRFENYCSQELKFVDGRPLSTKEINGYHGFGTKSIFMIANKYKGTCEMNKSGSHFIVQILFVGR